MSTFSNFLQAEEQADWDRLIAHKNLSHLIGIVAKCYNISQNSGIKAEATESTEIEGSAIT